MAKLGKNSGDVKVKFSTEYDGSGKDTAAEDLNNFVDTSAASSEKLQNKWAKTKETLLKVAAVGYTMKKAWDLAEQAAQFDQQEQAFVNLAASHNTNAKNIVSDLKAMSAHSISTANIMKSAGNAMVLGIPADKLSKMMAIARASSRLTGHTIQKSFDDMAMGVGRQSRMILDNLGITVRIDDANKAYAATLKKNVDALTDTERKKAFLNATLEAGEDIMRRVNIQNMTAAEGMQAFTATLENAKIMVGKVIVYLVSQWGSGLMFISEAFARMVAFVTEGVAKFYDVLALVDDKYAETAASVREFAEFERGAADEAYRMAVAVTEVGSSMFREKEAIGGVIKARQEQVKVNEKVRSTIDAQVDENKKWLAVNQSVVRSLVSLDNEYLKLMHTEEELLGIEAERMMQRGVDTELINEWLLAHARLLDQKQHEKDLDAPPAEQNALVADAESLMLQEDPEIARLHRINEAWGEHAMEVFFWENQKAKAVQAAVQAVGQAYMLSAQHLAQFVATGKFSAKAYAAAMMEMAANSVLAIGQEAAVKAVYALAEGFLFPAKAASSFKAAALYGKVAGMSLVVGTAMKASGMGLGNEGQTAAPVYQASPGTGVPAAVTHTPSVAAEPQQNVTIKIYSATGHIPKETIDMIIDGVNERGPANKMINISAIDRDN